VSQINAGDLTFERATEKQVSFVEIVALIAPQPFRASNHTCNQDLIEVWFTE
jgi:hypothetical protein